MKKTLFAILFLVGCSGGGSGTEETTPPSTPTPTNPDAGTVLETSCDGTTLIETIADGNGGSTQETTENSEQCGYEEPQFAPEGTPEGDPYCGNSLPQDRFTQLLNAVQNARGEDKFQDYADGVGGTYTEIEQNLSQDCFVQMEEPPQCMTTATSTDDSRYDYITCDGIKQKTNVSFPYSSDHEGTAVIDILVAFDIALNNEEDLDGMTAEEFVLYQFYKANEMFIQSGVDIRLRLVEIWEVQSQNTDLRGEYYDFFYSRAPYQELDEKQQAANADIAFLFKKRPENPIACGVAQLDGTKGLDYTRGITQCFHNSVFQENAATRYYERAAETFIHEVGHILGLEHHWQEVDNPAGVGLLENSYGYLVPGYRPQQSNPEYTGVYDGYGTIMSYSDLATRQFSDTDSSFTIPETGQSKKLGDNGGCFCLIPVEEQPPGTEAVKHLQRVRYLMSQLNELEHGLQYSPAFNTTEQEIEICLF